jgi:solute carrier family 25 S-adenosylmethionine transporter 26
MLSPLSATAVPAPLLHGLASASAELVSCAILTPAEVVKQNAQMSTSSATSSSVDVFRRLLLRSSSAASLFRGYVALAARNLPFTALQFPLFEAGKERIRRRREERGRWVGSVAEQACVTAVAAGGAGAVAAVVTTPVDVVKTRVMLGEAEEKGAWKVGRDIWKREGIRGLFRGGALRGVWTMVGSGLYLGAYDLARVGLAARRGEAVSGEELF